MISLIVNSNNYKTVFNFTAVSSCVTTLKNKLKVYLCDS